MVNRLEITKYSNVVIMPTLQSLAATEVACKWLQCWDSDIKVGMMTTLGFQRCDEFIYQQNHTVTLWLKQLLSWYVAILLTTKVKNTMSVELSRLIILTSLFSKSRLCWPLEILRQRQFYQINNVFLLQSWLCDIIELTSSLHRINTHLLQHRRMFTHFFVYQIRFK